MNSYDFFIYEFIRFMNSYMNSSVPRIQMSSARAIADWRATDYCKTTESFDDFQKNRSPPLSPSLPWTDSPETSI